MKNNLKSQDHFSTFYKTNDALFLMQKEDANIKRIRKVCEAVHTDVSRYSIKPIELWDKETTLTVEEKWSFTDNEGRVLDSGLIVKTWTNVEGKWQFLGESFCPNLVAIT